MFKHSEKVHRDSNYTIMIFTDQKYIHKLTVVAKLLAFKSSPHAAIAKTPFMRIGTRV